MLFRRRHAHTGDHHGLDDVIAVVVGDDAPTPAQREAARGAELRTLRRIAAEAVLVQDDAEQVLREIRARGRLADLAPRGGALTSRFVALAQALPDSRDPEVQQICESLRQVFDHHALMLSTSMQLLAVAWRSERLDEQLDRITGLGRPAQWLEDIRFELLVAA